MKKGIIVLLAAVAVLSMTGASFAEEGELGVTLDTTWVSKYIWRGVDVLDDKAAIQPSVDIDLYGSGFSANVWMSWAGASGSSDVSTVNADEMDYTLTYTNAFSEGDTTQMNYSAWFRYYDFTDMATKDADAQELGFAVSMPNLCPGGVVPSYAIIQMWNAKSGGAASGLGGSIHVVGLNYGLEVDSLEQPLNLGFDATFNDGAGVGGGAVSSDWSHITWSIGTSMQVGDGVLTPSIHYQTSMEDTVNKNDEFYTGISYSLSF
jgi:hypothetical protein